MVHLITGWLGIDYNHSCNIEWYQVFVSFFVGKGHSQKVIGFLLTKLDINQEKVKAPTLEIFRHLINSCGKRKE